MSFFHDIYSIFQSSMIFPGFPGVRLIFPGFPGRVGTLIITQPVITTLPPVNRQTLPCNSLRAVINR